MKKITVDDITAKKYKRKSLLAFVVFFALLSIGWVSWNWLLKQPKTTGVQQPLRKVLNTNEAIFKSGFDTNTLATEYPKSEAVKKVRVNGSLGMSDFDATNWKLQLVKAIGDTLLITMDDIKKLPKTEVVFDFKCIEGWSQKTWWGGVKFSDFAKHYNLDIQTKEKYIGMQTPDKAYYVGIDMPSMLQKQTILCYEMNGQPLPMNQGYPLRLIIPVKYGVKHLKRIGTIFFSNDKPKDYWAEKGYDYYTGH